jgi:hypothetical protein
VAKMALIERELKRDRLVAKFAKKHGELKATSRDPKRSDEERAAARLAPTRTLFHYGSSAWHVPPIRPGPRQDP